MKTEVLTAFIFVVVVMFLLTLTTVAQGPTPSVGPNPTVTPTPVAPVVFSHVPYNPFRRLTTLPEYPYNNLNLKRPQSYPLLTKPVGVDLDVSYINRTPLYNRYEVWYTPNGKPYLRPGTENYKRWPALGEVVTFTAHIVNKGTASSGNFAFKWFIDGIEVGSGTHSSLAPGEEGTENHQWVWAHVMSGERLQGSHTIRFTVDPANAIPETYESNNTLEDRTDALSLVLAVTPQLYSALETPVNSQWPFSAEDWLQKQISAMNAAFVRSVYASTPSGIVERVRLDKILVTSSVPPADLTEDGGFFVTADDRFGNAYYDPATDVSGALIHELTHQLGIIDMYNLDVPLETPQVIDRLSRPIQMEYSSAYLFPGLMNNPGIRPPIYDEHTSLGLDTNKGYRRGYYGEYLYDVPLQTFIRVLDNRGSPATGVTAKLYQRSSGPNQYGSQQGTIDNTPEISGVTDGSALILLTNRSVGISTTTNTGHTLRDNPFGVIDVVANNDEFILELSKGVHQEYSWLDITRFNLLAWQGGVSSATIQMTSHVPPDDAPIPPSNLTGIQESGLVKLQWSPSPGASNYNVYRTSGPAYLYQRIVTGTIALSYTVSYDSGYSAVNYTVTSANAQGRESGFSNLFYAFRLINPTSLAVDAQNRRIVLDPQNGYALYHQLPDGTLIDTRGSCHYHLEYSRFLARDFQGHLIFSHPADYYSSRHSVRVADQDANPLIEFGQQGSAPGQFQTPTGVAAWYQPYRILVADSGNNRIQAFDATGNFVSTYGSSGSGPGQFNNPQGLTVDANGNVIVADPGNSRLQVLSFDGTNFGFIRSISAGLNAPSGIACYGANRIIVADTGNNMVKVLDAAGNILGVYSTPTDGRSGNFNQPRGVVIDYDGNILVADTGNKRVVAILGVFPVYSISGHVTDVSNKGISGVAISDGAGHSATTDTNGNYTLSGLAAGTYAVTPSKSSYTFSPTSLSVAVPPNATGQNFTASQILPWTVMFYLDGDNSLDNTYPPIFNQLEAAANNPNVNVVALWDKVGNNNSAYYKVQYDTDLNKLANYTANVNYWPQGESNMGNPQTVVDFVNWARTNFPAQHYALILDDHGGGLGGAMQDATSDNDILTVNEIGTALASATNNGTNKIDVLYMNSCLMGMIEDAYQVRSYANYYVASENTQGVYYPPYSSYISGITATTTPAQSAALFTNRFADEAAKTSDAYTMSAADISKLDNLVTATNSLAQLLNSRMVTSTIQLTTVATNVQRFEMNGDHLINTSDSYIDLYDFARLVKANFSEGDTQVAAQSVMNAVTAYIFTERHQTKTGTAVGNSHGVSIFFPPNASSFYDATRYDFAVGATWHAPIRVPRGTQVTIAWGPMLVNYFQITQPGGPDTSTPPPVLPKQRSADLNFFLPFIRKQ